MYSGNLVPPPADSRDTPGIGFLVFVEQRLQSLVLLELAQLGWVGEFEERGRVLDQPLGVYGRHFSHVFFCRLHQLVIYDPVEYK